MTSEQKLWAESRNRLSAAVVSLEFPAEFADLLSGQLKSPRAMDRMTSYLRHVRPRSVEMVVDEMLAICADAEAWRQKKKSQEAQAEYSSWLNSEERRKRGEE